MNRRIAQTHPVRYDHAATTHDQRRRYRAAVSPAQSTPAAEWRVGTMPNLYQTDPAWACAQGHTSRPAGQRTNSQPRAIRFKTHPRSNPIEKRTGTDNGTHVHLQRRKSHGSCDAAVRRSLRVPVAYRTSAKRLTREICMLTLLLMRLSHSHARS